MNYINDPEDAFICIMGQPSEDSAEDNYFWIDHLGNIFIDHLGREMIFWN